MRIGITSDIHFNYPWLTPIKNLSGHLQNLNLDCFIIAGDLGEPLEMFETTLQIFEPVSPVRAALAGNHDVWHRVSHLNSSSLWNRHLEEKSKQYGYAWLDRENLHLGSLGICGSVVWYDYSSREPDIDISPDEYERIKKMISNDARYIDWKWSDREFSELVHDEFEERLKSLQEDEDVTDILVASHVPLFEGCIRYLEDDGEHVIANAYYGNWTTGQTVLKYDKVRMSVAGHIHRQRHVTVERENGDPLPVYTNPSDYGKPAAIVIDTDDWSVKIIKHE